MNCAYCNAVDVANNFCWNCGNKLPKSIEEETIVHYFKHGHTYSEIIDFLSAQNIVMSIRTLKRRIKNLQLSRKKMNVNEEELRSTITKETPGPSAEIGYRSLWHKLRCSRGVFVPRDKVMSIARELDPNAVEQRKRKTLHRRHYKSAGPNDCWHIDGYDKLKPYGFPIHGCIDGYSRKVLWLKVVKSNNDPKNVALLYLETIFDLGYIPKNIRSDCGSENVDVAGIHTFLRRDVNDESSGIEAHRFGTSHHNQRIEAWWSQMRKSQTNFMINFFRQLVDEVYNPEDPLHKACAWFCFEPLINKNLQEFKEQWNSHFIRRSQYCEVNGRPNYLYSFPSIGKSDQKQPIRSETDFAVVTESLNLQTEDVEDQRYSNFFNRAIEQLNYKRIFTWNDSKELFLILLNYANQPFNL